MTSPGRKDRRGVLLCAAVAMSGTIAVAADLLPATVEAFNRYVAVAERQRQSGPTFLWIDGDAPAERAAREAVRRGELAITRIDVRPDGRAIAVPDGLVHHWLGTVFVPGATVDHALALLQDYNRHATIYHPAVAQSRLLTSDGGRFTFFLRFFMKKVITVVVNSEHEGRFTRHDPVRAESRIYSTRVAEVEDPGSAGEREKPVGHDGGYLWRLNSYWRFDQRDGGVYLQCESISLTRGIPFGLGWVVRPFVTSIPRETLTFTLETTRKALQAANKAARDQEQPAPGASAASLADRPQRGNSRLRVDGFASGG
jgi:hypothetical protein